MYFNKYPSIHQPQKEIIKRNKIFRPWDSVDNNNKIAVPASQDYLTRRDFDNSPQDATISTTTENEDSELNLEETKKSNLISDETESLTKNSSISLKESKRNSAETEKLVFTSNQKFPHENVETVQPLVDYPVNLEGYPLYPDYVHVNLAHSLGLTPSDPLFLECVNQGCTLEEYTRVISQEHQAKLLSARKQRPKKYRCPHCDVGFSNNGQLKGHIRIHTGERPFRCDENNCGKTFTRNEELTRHKRIHSGLRPFPCTHCGKRFGRKDHLKKHSRTHFQPRGIYAVPVMLPFDTWTSSNSYPFVPMFTY